MSRRGKAPVTYSDTIAPEQFVGVAEATGYSATLSCSRATLESPMRRARAPGYNFVELPIALWSVGELAFGPPCARHPRAVDVRALPFCRGQRTTAHPATAPPAAALDDLASGSRRHLNPPTGPEPYQPSPQITAVSAVEPIPTSPPEEILMKKILSIIGLPIAGLLLAACGDNGADSGDATGGGSDSPSAAAEFNDADVTFAQGMIPHHEQAIEMAQLAAERAEREEVKQLAADIEAAQGPEIERLTTWLEAWGEDDPSGEMDHGDMNGGDSSSDMGGMMTSEDMAMLEEASGVKFDEMFLEMMIEHHRGAVTMAETEVAEGENADAIAMAEDIIATQNAEIEQMQQLLG